MRNLGLTLYFAGAALLIGSAGDTLAQSGNATPQKWPAGQSRGLVDAATEARITALLGQMSVEEKVGQTIQAAIYAIHPNDLREYPLGSILAGGDTPPMAFNGNQNERGPAQLWVETARAYRSVSMEKRAGHTPIPVIFGVDVIHGNNNVVGATLFPHNIGLGAMRDAKLLRRIGEISAHESAAVGVDWAFAPTLAVPQDDRWGRTYEGYAENPTLVREYAEQMVLGLQGEPGVGRLAQRGLVAASAKHFLGDGGTTDGIDQGDAAFSEDELIRVHAPGYQAAIDAGVMTVMASYSSWQGQKMHGNRSLLTDVLKDRMGFKGFVIGDWNGHSQVPGCKKRNCAIALNAGVDMIMAPDAWKPLFHNLVAQAKSGQISRERLDDAVRRVLRVKFRLGLFDADLPWTGRLNVLGAPEHRAVAREAVRKSLVLLKNNGAVLPIKASARVLVTGSGADSIAQQNGGWTLSWQGNGNTNSDFPNAQSIYAGLREALTFAGGSAQLSADGSFANKPDVAVVVFGEEPYAEMRGDLRTLEYQAGDKRDLALLRKLRAAGVKVVSVFLSGRPLWINPELNASDAFVAAWLPGSEGGGIADVLIGNTEGKARHDFHGKLSFSWPKTAAQTALNFGKQPYDPLFAYDYGLTYRDRTTLAAQPEDPRFVIPAAPNPTYLSNGLVAKPWQWALQNVELRSVADVAELRFAASKESIAMLRGPLTNLQRESNAGTAIAIEYRVDQAPAARVTLEARCATGCGQTGALDLSALLKQAPLKEWRKVKVRLSCFREAGLEVSKIVEPLVIATNDTFGLSLRNAQLEADPEETDCPPEVIAP
jgi:beta-glucosidase